MTYKLEIFKNCNCEHEETNHNRANIIASVSEKITRKFMNGMKTKDIISIVITKI